MVRAIRVLIVVFVMIVPGLAALAQNDSYLRVTGIPGTSQAEGREAWNDVESFALTLLPPAPEKDNAKILVNRCSLSVKGVLEKAGGAAVALIGDVLADPVLIEVDRNFQDQAQRIYQARLHGAQIVGYDGSGNGGLAESLIFHFAQAEVTTWAQNPDGTIGSSTSGMFNCGPTP